MLAIISAMPDEITAIVQSLGEATFRTLGQRQYHAGNFGDTPVVVVFSGWGKVAAANSVSEMEASRLFSPTSSRECAALGSFA